MDTLWKSSKGRFPCRWEGGHLDELNDEDLLNLYFVGEAAAFQAFFRRHSRRVLAYGRSKGLTEQDAQDFVQEAFLKLHRSIHLYEKGRPALPWFFTMVHRVLIDQVRRLKSQAKHRQEVDLGFSPELASPGHGEVNLERPTEVSLGSLSDDQRKIVELRMFDELPFKDISSLTGKTEAASRKIFERAVKTLRKLAGKES